MPAMAIALPVTVTITTMFGVFITTATEKMNWRSCPMEPAHSYDHHPATNLYPTQPMRHFLRRRSHFVIPDLRQHHAEYHSLWNGSRRDVPTIPVQTARLHDPSCLDLHRSTMEILELGAYLRQHSVRICSWVIHFSLRLLN